MVKRSAFTLLELVIAIAIAAIIGLSLTTILNQSYASQRKLESTTHLYERATLLFTQLERDLMGATIPIENILALEGSRAKKQALQQQTALLRQGSEGQAVQQTQEKKEKEEPPYKPIDRVFYYTHNKTQMFFSWITRDPLQLYWGSSVGSARPRIARVMYRLQQDKEDKTLFKLMRAEGFDLTYTPYEKHTDQKYTGFMLVDDIKHIKITCVAIVVKPVLRSPGDNGQAEKQDTPRPSSFEGQARRKEQEQPPVMEVKMLDTWEWPRSEEDNKKGSEKKEQELPPLPQGILIELVLWDAATEREVKFEYAIEIPSLPVLYREKKDGDKKQDQKEQPAPEGGSKPDQGGVKPGGNQLVPIINADAGGGKSGRSSTQVDLFGGGNIFGAYNGAQPHPTMGHNRNYRGRAA